MGKSSIKPIDFDEMGGSMVIYRFLWKITYKLPFKPRKMFFPLPLLVTPGIPIPRRPVKLHLWPCGKGDQVCIIMVVLPTDAMCCPDINIENVVLSNI